MSKHTAAPDLLLAFNPYTRLASARNALTRVSPYAPEYPAAMRRVRAAEGELSAFRALPVSR